MSDVIMHWRPGCGFCSGLMRGLEASGLLYTKVNIWEDPAGAEFVRSVADGNEVVPTVKVGEIALVNPSVRELLAAVAEHAPDALPGGYEPPAQGRVAKTVTKILGG
jgi:mycoredoxin